MSDQHTDGTRVRFRLAGFVFTYRRGSSAARVRIDMWREDPATTERYWITVATCAPRPEAARAVALALAAWVRSLDVGPKVDLRSRAVAESWALMQARVAEMAPGAQVVVSARRVEPGVQAAARLASMPAENDLVQSVPPATAQRLDDEARGAVA